MTVITAYLSGGFSMPDILLITLYALGLFSLPTQVWGRYFYYPQDRGQRDSKVHPTMRKEFGRQPWQCIKSLAPLKLTLIYVFIVCACMCLCVHMPVYLCA